MPGDVDGNGELTISDISMLINCLITENTDGINLSNADLNGDGELNVSDITILVNYVLTGNEE